MSMGVSLLEEGALTSKEPTTAAVQRFTSASQKSGKKPDMGP